MISDKLSVGPSQLPGEIDGLNVRTKDLFTEKSLNSQKDKKDFEKALAKKDNEFRETSGGTNRKMFVKKIDRNPKRLSSDVETEKKEQQPTSNPMAFQQSRVEVVDSDKNPDRESSSDLEASQANVNPKSDLRPQDQTNEVLNPNQDDGDALLQELAAGLATASMPSSDAEALIETPPQAMDAFQADVFQQLQQSQQSQATVSSSVIESELSTQDLSETLDAKAGNKPLADQLSLNLNADQIQAQLAKSMENAAQNNQSQQFSGQSFDQSFATNQSQNNADGLSQDRADTFKMEDKALDELKNQTQSPHQVTTHASGQNSFQPVTAPSAAFAGDKSVSATQAQNTNEIVKQAEFLVKDGGGTAKIRMTPEGLGTVDLRVTLQDGKVQVELNTTDPQAKKLLQDSMTDLKSSLASHNFNLGHVKINNMSVSTELNQQNSNSQSFLNQQHSGQNQNWNQFEGQMQQQQNRQAQQGRDFETRSSFFKPENSVQAEARQSFAAAPKIARGYGAIAKNTSSMTMVA